MLLSNLLLPCVATSSEGIDEDVARILADEPTCWCRMGRGGGSTRSHPHSALIIPTTAAVVVFRFIPPIVRATATLRPRIQRVVMVPSN